MPAATMLSVSLGVGGGVLGTRKVWRSLEARPARGGVPRPRPGRALVNRTRWCGFGRSASVANASALGLKSSAAAHSTVVIVCAASRYDHRALGDSGAQR